MRKVNMYRLAALVATAGTLMAWGCGWGQGWRAVATYTAVGIGSWLTGYYVNSI